eukprot:Phypoly_transcript_12011.p1 GENE.Phypoly_transcript_12011~~Phypoly_transcript_12011.p1  ORF type:complete len:316 (+),score=32.34 Phypoly_transcript_12011:115-1062(+)
MQTLWFIVAFFACVTYGTFPWPDIVDYNHTNNWAESGAYSFVLDELITGSGPNLPYHLLKISRNGSTTQFAADSRFASADIFTQGIKVDDIRGRVYFIVANISLVFGSPPSPGKFQSAFAEADLFTGKILRYVDLSSVASPVVSANDLVRYHDGSFFITDIFGRLLKLETDDTVSIFSEDNKLKRTTLWGVNGIIGIKDEQLLVGNFDLGTLIRIHVQTKRIENVHIGNGGIICPDGIALGLDGDLYVAQNVQGANKTVIARLRTYNNWITARRIGVATSNTGGGSAVIFRHRDVYVSHSNYPPPKTGVFDRVRF